MNTRHVEATSDGPRALAFLICQAALPTPTNGLNLIEVGSDTFTWQFPNGLPPHVAVCVLINGRPKTVYSTSWSLIDPTGAEIGRIPGPDAPFTTQIKRVNVFIPIQQIAPNYKVSGPGRYLVRLDVAGEPVGESELMIIQIPKPATPVE